MTIAAIDLAHRPAGPSRKAAPAPAAAAADRAMQALRAGRLDAAWLWADKLCRMVAEPGAADAYLLRSAVFALRGDRAEAEADLRVAARIDPEAPAVNRALLASYDAAERLAAARRLLGAADAGDRDRGYAALSCDGFNCVGLLEHAARHLRGRLAWNGLERIAVQVRTDVGDQRLELRAVQGRGPSGFEHHASFRAALPKQATVATVLVEGATACFEPSVVLLAPPTRQADKPPRCDLLVVVPVYDDRAATMACLDSLLDALPRQPSAVVVVVDDASPDALLSASLDRLAADARIKLLRNAINMGFAGSVNRALALRHPGQDVLLLNADTIVPAGAIDAMIRHLRACRDIGTVTPLSNNGESTSLPRRFVSNPMPPNVEIAALQGLAAQVNAGHTVDMPNGIGFCLLIRGELCDRLGPLSHGYGRGYYEDVELCLKAAEAGYRNVCATDAFVGHHGSRSFAQAKRALVVRNLRRISDCYPSYRAVSQAFETADPLKESIGRVEEAVLRAAPPLDILLIAADTPAIVMKAILAGTPQPTDRLVIARVRRGEYGLAMSLTGTDGRLPQNIEWRIDADRDDELVRRLAGWSVGTVTVLDPMTLPRSVVAAMTRLAPQTRLLIARPYALDPLVLNPLEDGGASVATAAVTDAVRQAMSASCAGREIAALTCPQLPELEAPCLSDTSGVLTVVATIGTRRDIHLLRALAQAIPARNDGPAIVVAGRLPREAIASLPATVHVGGAIDDADLPRWLTRLGPQAVLFGDPDWGAADPRAAHWDAALPVARFDWRAERPRRQGRGLLLPRDGRPAALADAIASWMSPGQA